MIDISPSLPSLLFSLSLPHHEPPDSLLLQKLLLLPLLPLHHGMVAQHGLAQTRHFALVVAVELLEVAAMLQDAGQVLLEVAHNKGYETKTLYQLQSYTAVQVVARGQSHQS